MSGLKLNLHDEANHNQRLSVEIILDCLNHIVRHLIGHAGINADPEGAGRDDIGVFKFPDDTIAFARVTHLVETGMLDEIACKQHACLHALALDKVNKGSSVDTLSDREEETEPAWTRILFSDRKDQFIL